MLLIAFLTLLRSRKGIKLQVSDNSQKGSMFLLGIPFAAGCIFVVASQISPRTDQYALVRVAAELKANVLSSLLPCGYLDQYPNQIGMVLLYYFGSAVFGQPNFIAIQLINVLALVGCYWLLSAVSRDLLNAMPGTSITLVALILFIPLFFYVTFVYGTLVGLFMCLLALRRVQMYFLPTNTGIYSLPPEQ